MTYVALYTLTTPALVLVGTGIAIVPRLHGRRDGQPGRPRLLARCSTRSPRPPTTTAAPSAASPSPPTSSRSRWGWRCCIGRLLPIVLVLLLAGSLAEQGKVPGHRGHPPHPQAPLRRDAGRRHPRHDRPDLLPGARPRTDRGGPRMTTTSSPASPPSRAGPYSITPRPSTTHRPTVAGHDAARPARPGCSSCRRRPQARPAAHVALAGDVPGAGSARSRPPSRPSATRASSRSRSPAWLWLTVLFGNLAEAVAEGRGKAQAASLRATRTDTVARLLAADGAESEVPGDAARVGDLVVVEAGQVIPGDGDSSRASPRSTSRPSPASPPRSSARRAATAAPSPAAPACCRTASSSASPQRRARPSSTR